MIFTPLAVLLDSGISYPFKRYTRPLFVKVRFQEEDESEDMEEDISEVSEETVSDENEAIENETAPEEV